MGQERDAKLKWQGETLTGQALLESDEIIFKRSDGKPRVVLPFRNARTARATKGVLVIDLAKGRAELDLGTEVAEAWAYRMANPKGRIEKLGITEGTTLTIVGAIEDEFLAEVKAEGAVVKAKPAAKNALVILAPATVKDLAQVKTLKKNVAPEGALWIVYPKGQKDLREADVMEAGRDAGMKDVKVARFSDTHTGLKFVVPIVERK